MLKEQQFYLIGHMYNRGQSFTDTSPYEISEYLLVSTEDKHETQNANVEKEV